MQRKLHVVSYECPNAKYEAEHIVGCQSFALALRLAFLLCREGAVAEDFLWLIEIVVEICNDVANAGAVLQIINALLGINSSDINQGLPRGQGHSIRQYVHLGNPQESLKSLETNIVVQRELEIYQLTGFAVTIDVLVAKIKRELGVLCKMLSVVCSFLIAHARKIPNHTSHNSL